MEPMLLVMVTNVARARSSLLMASLFSLLIMLPKLCWKYQWEYSKSSPGRTQASTKVLWEALWTILFKLQCPDFAIMVYEQTVLCYEWLAAPFLTRDKVVGLLTGKKIVMLLDIWTRMEQGKLVVFQNLLSKLPYFKHKCQVVSISVLCQGQEIKFEVWHDRYLHQAGRLAFTLKKKTRWMARVESLPCVDSL